MEEAIIFQRRNRLKKHFVVTSNVLLYGYQGLSDGAKITFQIIDGFDWEDKNTKDSKGYVFPAIATLATIRGVSERTIWRHIKELIGVNLLTRVRRRNLPSVFYIEDVSNHEAERYLTTCTDQGGGEKVESPQATTDKNGSSHRSQVTKMAVSIQKENKARSKPNETNVNAEKKTRQAGLASIGTVLKQYRKYHDQRQARPDDVLKRDYFAIAIAEKLNDHKSLGFYRRACTKYDPHRLLKKAAEIATDGGARKPGAVFVHWLQEKEKSLPARL